MKRTLKHDPELEAIADLERRIVQAHDEKTTLLGVSAEEIARERPAVVAETSAAANRKSNPRRPVAEWRGGGRTTRTGIRSRSSRTTKLSART